MIRITTNSSLRMYRSNLMKSTNSLNSAMTKLMTQRAVQLLCVESRRGHPGLQNSQFPQRHQCAVFQQRYRPA